MCNSIYHETMIQYPRSTSLIESLSVTAPNTNLGAQVLANLIFATLRTDLSNGSVKLDYVRTDVAQLKTSNGKIEGDFDIGHLDVNSTNGSLVAKLNIRDAFDGRQSVVSTKTSNAHIDLHITVTDTN